jgi:hypothetical protein
MLRRLFTITFALLLFALAFSIPRSTAPPDSVSPAVRIVANLFLPQIAIAQATASAPAQTQADNPTSVAVIDTGPGTVDTLSKSEQVVDDKSSHSHAIIWGCLALIVVVALAAWFISRRSNNGSGGGGVDSSGYRRPAT